MRRLFRLTYYHHFNCILLLLSIMYACHDDTRIPPSSMNGADLKANQNRTTNSGNPGADKSKDTPKLPILPNQVHAATTEHTASAIPKEERIMIISNGTERYISVSEAEEQGYQIKRKVSCIIIIN